MSRSRHSGRHAKREPDGRAQANGSRTRLRVAEEAARLMVESGIKDFHLAKQKAAARLGVYEDMPRNAEIETALMEYQRLFYADTQPARLRQLREVAVEAMQFFKRFEPRLVGSVLRGSAGEHSDMNLHVFADTAEEVEMYLMDNDIPFETQDRRMREGRDTFQEYPVYRFVADDITVDLTVFTREAVRKAPLSPVDGKPMERADLNRVRALLELDDSGIELSDEPF